MAIQPFNAQLKTNRLKTKAECEQALVDMLEPAMELMIKGGRYGRFRMSDSGAVYSQDRTSIEGFCRLLWGLGPLFSETNRHNINRFGHWWQFTTESVIRGTTPGDPDYWGDPLIDYDQLFVEMGAITAFLYETEHDFWDHLTHAQQENILDWLDQVNHHVVPQCNWLLFQAMVNTWLVAHGRTECQQYIDKCFETTNSHYLGHGWSYDGFVDHIDNYIPFAYQFFTLVLVGLTKGTDAQSNLLRERATPFVESYANWFAADGACLPYGRSLDYRFAQAAFWGAAAFAGIEPPAGWSLGDYKRLLMGNLRWWFRQNMFQSDGLIPIGYAYPNMNMAEGYNGPASAYWALKTFIFLCLPDDDPFWSVRESEEFKFEPVKVQPEPHMLVEHSRTGQEVRAYVAGQHNWQHAHGEAKYEKFVYSSTFAFSVPKGGVTLGQGAYDSALAVSEGEYFWRTMFTDEKAWALHDDYVYTLWQPWDNVSIQNFTVPAMPWHVRVHVVDTARTLHLAEGSFALPDYGETVEATGAGVSVEANGGVAPKSLFYRTAEGVTGLVASEGFDVDLSTPEPNTNLQFPKTRIPQQTRVVEPGKYVFVSLYLGDRELESLDAEGRVVVPAVSLDGNVLTIAAADGTTRTVTLEEFGE